jgi:phage recombination protein Bet
MEQEGKLTVLPPAGPTSLPSISFSREQIDLIKRTVAKDTTDDELALFLHVAKRTGLDPLMRQIHCVKRQGQMAMQTAIDGYRLIADRTGKYAGNDDPLFDDEAKPMKATVTVYKLVDGERCPFTATARWDQYYPGDKQGFMWKKMPHLMLGKCAEALALRKAFPAELSEVYTNEEMEQAGDQAIPSGDSRPAIRQPEPKASDAPPADETVGTYQGTVFKVTNRKISTKDGEKTKFEVYADEKTSFSTIREKEAEKAESIAGSATQARIVFVKTKWGNDIRSVTILDREAEN